jgi:hypothetical protein
MVFIHPKIIPSSSHLKQHSHLHSCINSQTSIAQNPPLSWERSHVVQAGTVSPDSANTQSRSLHDQPTSVEFRQAVSQKASIHEKTAVFGREPVVSRTILSLRMKAFKCKQNTTSDDAPEDLQSNLDSEFDTIKTSKSLAKLYMQSAEKDSKQKAVKIFSNKSSVIVSKDFPEKESIQVRDKFTQNDSPLDRPSEPIPGQQSKAPLRSILSLNPKHSPQLKSRVQLSRITKNLPVKRVTFSPTRTVFFVRK